ncbi:MAG: M56 family metallopeptidase [Clostridium sp.]|nr:M56 family metallopeptidase [Lachnoclostridium sp.]MCM1252638.1 M56 family metallopeptidase [Clostridium sp.]
MEINIGAAVVISILLLCADKLRKRYGAVWMKTVWLLLAVRLAIPYNFSLSLMEIRLFDRPGFETDAVEENLINAAGAGAGVDEQYVGMANDSAGADEQYMDMANDGAGAEWQQTDEAGVNVDINGNEQRLPMTDTDGNRQRLNAADTDTGLDGHQKNTSGMNIDAEPVFAAGADIDTLTGGQRADAADINAVGRRTDIAGIMLTIYLVGAGVCLLYVFAGYLLFIKNAEKNICPLRDERLKEWILTAQQKIMGKVCVPVVQSFHITSPMLIGIFCPRMVIPVSGKQWNEAELAFIMEHELCHYRKKDLLLKFFVTIVWCMNWFSPAVFLMKKQFFYDVELACDETVLQKCDDKEKETYARIILSVAGNGKKTPMFSTGFTEDKKRMKNRIDYIFDKRKRKKGAVGMITAGALILMMSVVVSCGYRKEWESADIAEQENIGQTAAAGGRDERTQTGAADSKSAEADALGENTAKEDISSKTPQDGEKPGKTGKDGTEQDAYAEFDYNHEYNALIRVYENDVYIAREKGIYRVKDGVGKEELIFENDYMSNRGMEIYQNYLYFTGQKMGKAQKETKTIEKTQTIEEIQTIEETQDVEEKTETATGAETNMEVETDTEAENDMEAETDTEAATIYRMNLDTLEVEDALAAYDQHFEYLHKISVYEEKLYVSEGFGHRTGFSLTADGKIGSLLDEDADDFLYQENNAYMDWFSRRINASNMEESDALMEEEAKLYQPLADTADCKKLLHGSFLVSRYKDELRRAAYLEHEDGTYEYLCDIYDGYELITEDGLYYTDGVSGDIMYVNFETKQSETILKQPEEDWMQICLLTYDADDIYLAANRHLGFDEEDNLILEISLQRIPRQGGAMEKLYQFESGIEWRMPWRLAGHCGVYGGYMYLAYYDTIHLEPVI